MTSDNFPYSMPIPGAPLAPASALSPELQRRLSLALLRAKPNCCYVCDALLPLQETLFRQLEQDGPPAPIQTLAADGSRSEAPPLERPPHLAPPAPAETLPAAPVLTH